MKKKRHTTEEIIKILRKADGKQTVEEICRELNISEQTFYRWRRKYGRMEMADAKRFKEPENENSELKEHRKHKPYFANWSSQSARNLGEIDVAVTRTIPQNPQNLQHLP